MAFADLTIQDNTPAAVVFRATSTASGKVIYSDASRSIMEPRTLTVSHQKTGKGASVRVRTLVRIDDTQVDSGDGVTPAVASAYFVIDRPGIILTADDLKHAIALLKNALTASNIDTLLAGQQL